MISVEGKNWDLKEKFSEDHWDTLQKRKKFLSLNLFFSTLFFFKNSDKKQKKESLCSSFLAKLLLKTVFLLKTVWLFLYRLLNEIPLSLFDSCPLCFLEYRDYKMDIINICMFLLLIS